MAAVAGTGGSTLPFGPGSALWKYWTSGPGFAKWSTAVHKWTTLNRLLKAAIPKEDQARIDVDGLTTNIIQATMPGYLKTNHKRK